jgi:hypothetical protein
MCTDHCEVLSRFPFNVYVYIYIYIYLFIFIYIYLFIYIKDDWFAWTPDSRVMWHFYRYSRVGYRCLWLYLHGTHTDTQTHVMLPHARNRPTAFSWHTVARNLARSRACIFVRFLILWSSGAWRRVVSCICVAQWFPVCGPGDLASLHAPGRRWMWYQVYGWRFHRFIETFSNWKLRDVSRYLIKRISTINKQTEWLLVVLVAGSCTCVCVCVCVCVSWWDQQNASYIQFIFRHANKCTLDTHKYSQSYIAATCFGVIYATLVELHTNIHT